MRFNSYGVNPHRTKNVTGAIAYDPATPEQKLYAITACSTLSAAFYSTEAKLTQYIFECAEQCDPDFISDLAIYLRNKMFLRTAPILLCGFLATKGKLRKETVVKVIQRADEIKEMVVCWKVMSGRDDLKKMPNQLKVGLAEAFNKFSTFQYSKYNKQGKEVITFLDVMRLVHPKPYTEAASETFRLIKENDLPVAERWETVLSSGMDKKEAWTYLLKEHKLPYMAALRNVRNIITSGVELSVFNNWLDIITDKKSILKSKQFPFRFYSAAKALNYLHDVRVKAALDAIETAIEVSIDNIPGLESYLDKSVLIVSDVSGSMTYTNISTFSDINLLEVGLLMSQLLAKKLKYVVSGVFASSFRLWSPSSNLLKIGDFPNVGHNTYAHFIIEWLNQEQKHFDKVMVFSDMGIYDAYQEKNTRSQFEKEWYRYISKFDSELYLFNLAGYGTFPIDVANKGVYAVSGFSEKIFEVISNWTNIKQIIQETKYEVS